MAVLAESELLRYTVPEEYGGFGVRVMNLCIIREELARVSAQADTNFIMQGLGSYPITLGGTHEQKARYLPPVARGESIAAFALTEPHAGSDVISMSTEAVPDSDDWVLNGRKKFISQAGDATTYTVFAKTDPGQGSRSLSAFIVERGTPGFDDSKRLELMAAHPIGEPVFQDCRIPQGNLIGERGQGLRLALGTLDTFRTTVAAAAIGMGVAAYEAALDYARNRPMFGQHAQRLSGDPVQAGGHGRVAGRRPIASPSRRVAQGLRPTDDYQGGIIRQAVRHRGRLAHRQRGGADPRRGGIWRRATASNVSIARYAP